MCQLSLKRTIEDRDPVPRKLTGRKIFVKEVGRLGGRLNTGPLKRREEKRSPRPKPEVQKTRMSRKGPERERGGGTGVSGTDWNKTSNKAEKDH